MSKHMVMVHLCIWLVSFHEVFEITIFFITLVCEKLLSICHVLERKNSECISFVSWIWTCLERVELNFTFVSAMTSYLLHRNLIFINHWIHLSISILVLLLMLWFWRSLRQFSLKALDWVIVVFSILVCCFCFSGLLRD